MRVKLLGTGAADGIPGFASDSEISRHALRVGGREVRTRSAALIDGHLKIDLGPDTFAQMAREGLSPSDWTAVVFTHTHDDHFCRGELQYFLVPFTDHEHLPLTVYGNDAVVAKLAERYPDWPLDIQLTRSFEPFDHIGYTITPIAAYHKLDEDSQNLVIEREGATLLYATDTGPWQEPTWKFMTGRRVDALVIECTDGLNKTSFFGHLDVRQCVEMVNTMRAHQILSSTTPIYVTHLAQHGGLTHEAACEVMEPHGIMVAYDGLEFEL